MNFFGQSGFLSIVEGKPKHPCVEVTGVKSLHSSEEELENNKRGSERVDNYKYGSLSRQQKSGQRIKNRKINPDFRSVWYDEEAEYDETCLHSSTEEANSGKITMRRAASLDNLLDINNRNRYKLTKNMISSPICPRKIQGNWTGAKDVAWMDTAIVEAEEAFLAQNKTENTDNLSDSESNTLGLLACTKSSLTDSNCSDPHSCEKLTRGTSDLTVNTFDDSDKENVLESGISFSPLLLEAVESNEISVVKSSSPPLPIKTFRNDEVVVMQSFESQITPKIIEPHPTETDSSCVPEKVTVNKKGMKKGPSFENLLKLNTFDNRGNKRRKIKIDISTPTMPRKIEANGDVIDMGNLDTEDVTNLLRMKGQSKSTNELLKSFNQIKNEKLEHLNDPKFPISESDEVEGEVQIRRHQNINQYRYSKTTDFDFGRKISSSNRDFEIRTCTKIQIPNENSPIKLKKTEIIKYQNGHLLKIDEHSKILLRSHVTLKGARLLNKRDVELKDSNNLTYIVFFDSSKDAKLFLENEKVSCYVDNDSKSTITKTLLRLLGKRSSREVLEKKGIYQNEPIFGNTLRNIYGVEKNVPDFILKTIELIESPDNITSLGLYRTSGNLATIQKIRFEVDKGRLNILNEFCKDVDVLTGCLKLFFRELKEPLIPYEICDSLLNITKTDKNYSKKDREKIRSIINKLPESNSKTLYVLIKHLIEVVRYKDENKMDTYNLAVCWGPTIIFITDNTENANGKDIVTQSTDATRLFDALLTFYIENPEELDFGRKKQEYLDSNKNPIQRQDSKESIRSSDSNNSKVQKKSASNLCLNVDEVLKKFIELIELNIKSEGLYKKSGSTEKISKIMKKITKKKICELEKYKLDTIELTDSFKKYLRDLPEPLATKESVDQVIKFCDNTPCLEQNNRQKIISLIEDLPKKDTLIYLVRHITKVMEQEPYHKVSKVDMVSIWTNVLNYQRRITDSNEKFSNYLRIVLEVFDEAKPDITLTPKSISNGLLNDLKNYQKDKDRCSKYDNVPEMDTGVSREATILEEKTEELEFTKL